MNYLNHQEDQMKAARWAAGVLADKDALILDTETTGLDGKAQVVQLAIIDTASGDVGDVKMDTLLRPTIPIGLEALEVHGITNESLQNKPTMEDIYPDLIGLFQDASRVIIYNVEFDVRILHQTLEAFGIAHWGQVYTWPCRFECAMLKYAEWFGEWARGSYRWQKLPGGDHTALGDCRATLGVLRKMAGTAKAGAQFSQLAWSEIEDGA